MTMSLFNDIFAALDIVFLFVVPGLFLIIFIPSIIAKRKCEKFVKKHSIALRELKIINSKQNFLVVPNLDVKNSYDNEYYFENISCLDYLTYQLTIMQKEIASAANASLDNEFLYKVYIKEVEEKCTPNRYDVKTTTNKKLLQKIEDKFLQKEMLKPITKFTMKVTLYRTDLHGYKYDSKSEEFSIDQIRNDIFRLKDRTNSGFYKNKDIWDSLCRVERGKVTNKLRFLVYERDGYRCCKCHKKAHDLEIDHIIPISKGGKSTYDNLQTLCHRCNVEKGSYIESDGYES